MIFESSCKRFSRLINDREDRPLRVDEQAFLDTHQSTCEACAELHRSSLGLNMLRLCSMEEEVSEGFDDRVVRMVKNQRRRMSWSYWSPALCGGVVACLAILAALQMISRPNKLPMFPSSGTDARRIEVHEPLFPILNPVQPTRDQ
jgi:hypothetical protein